MPSKIVSKKKNEKVTLSSASSGTFTYSTPASSCKPQMQNPGCVWYLNQGTFFSAGTTEFIEK
jgi:hypothetical protein